MTGTTQSYQPRTVEDSPDVQDNEGLSTVPRPPPASSATHTGTRSLPEDATPVHSLTPVQGVGKQSTSNLNRPSGRSDHLAPLCGNDLATADLWPIGPETRSQFSQLHL